MKKILYLTIMLFFLVPSSFAEEISKEFKQKLTGSYNGTVYSGNDHDPVITTFHFTEKGALVGKYAIGEEAELLLGELSNLRIEGKYTVVVDWKDKYGTGVLRILFSPNYKVFYGMWGTKDDRTTLPWNGVKK